MQKNLPYFLVIAALIFLIIGVLSSGQERKEIKPAQPASSMQNPLEAKQQTPQPKEAQVAAVQPTGQKPQKVIAKALFGFEGKTSTWEIPEWCFEKDDYVAEKLSSSSKIANEGKTSLELLANFPGKKWTAAYVETQEYFDWTPYQSISADVFLPADAPLGLKAKFILTVGEDWTWTEMSGFVKLLPGEWTTLTASISPGSTDWRKTEVTDEFRADVRKLGIRIESNMQPVYNGPIYIDNVRVE